MKIYLNELSENDTTIEATQDDPWLVAAVLRADEQSSEHSTEHHGDLGINLGASLTRRPGQPRAAQAQFHLHQVDGVAVVSGHIDSNIELVCSRCASGFAFPVQVDFMSLFCKDPVMAGVAHATAGGRIEGQTKGFARHAQDKGRDPETGQDLDITYLTQEFIDLAEVTTEQIQLQIPFQPLCKEDCKGICVHCGTDLNVGRCACAKIQRSTPFSVLKDYKLNP